MRTTHGQKISGFVVQLFVDCASSVRRRVGWGGVGGIRVHRHAYLGFVRAASSSRDVPPSVGGVAELRRVQ